MRIHSVHELVEYRHSISTKPFAARGANVVRCRFCKIEHKYCICSYQPNIETNVAALILMSESEVMKPSNTGRLIADVVKETYTFQWSRTEVQPQLAQLIKSEQYYPVVIFPQEYVEEKARLIQEKAPLKLNGRKLLMIYLDGSWREARRMFRKSPYLALLPVLSITPDTLSDYRMRKSDNVNHLATAEVACLILKMVGEVEASNHLTYWFDLFRESYLLSKTREKSDFSRPALQNYLAHYPTQEVV